MNKTAVNVAFGNIGTKGEWVLKLETLIYLFVLVPCVAEGDV